MTDVGNEALDLLTVSEVATRLRLSIPTIRRLIRSGELESVKVGSARRVAPEAIIDYKKQLRESARSSHDRPGEQHGDTADAA